MVKERTELKQLLTRVLSDIGITNLTHIYKSNVTTTRKDFIKKLRSPSITWKTFKEGLPLLNISDAKLHIEACFPKSKDTYNDPITCFVPLITEATEDGEPLSTTRLGHNELRDLLELLLIGSGMNQVTYNNRILMSLTDADSTITPTVARSKLEGFIKKMKQDEITWRTFHQAVTLSGAGNIVLSISFTKDGKAYTSKVDVKGESNDDIFS